MIQNILKTIIISLLLAPFANESVPSINQEKKKMEKMTFIPKEFNEIKLGYDERKMVNTTPGYPEDMIRMNTIFINTPRIIYYSNCNSDFKPVIPLSAIYVISSRRSWKYIHLAAKVIHVKNIEKNIEASGKIYEKRDPNISEFPISNPITAKDRQERDAQIKEAQKYSDDELENDGYMDGRFINVDIMEYVDFPFLPGKYEIWLSFSGLESNHAIVEIIKRK